MEKKRSSLIVKAFLIQLILTLPLAQAETTTIQTGKLNAEDSNPEVSELESKRFQVGLLPGFGSMSQTGSNFSAVDLGVDFRFFPLSHFALGATLTYNPLSLSTGEAKALTTQFSKQFHFDLDLLGYLPVEDFEFWGGARLGYALVSSSYRVSSGTVSSSSYSVQQGHFEYGLALGADYRLNSQFSLGLDASILFASYTTKSGVVDVNNSPSVLQIFLPVKFHF